MTDRGWKIIHPIISEGKLETKIGTLPNFRGKAKRMSNKTEMITVI